MRTAVVLVCLMAAPAFASRSLSLVQRQPATQSRSLAISADGAYVYAAGGTTLGTFARDAGTGLLTLIDTQQDGVGGVDGLDNAQSVVITPDGNHVYVAGNGDDAVAVFARDGGTGLLTFVEVQRNGVAGVTGLTGPTFLAVSPDGQNVYASANNYPGSSNAVVVFARNVITGSLTFVEAQQDGVGGVDGLSMAYAVAVSPDGANVYVAGRADDAVAVFARAPGTGALTFVELQRHGVAGVVGLLHPSEVVPSPDGTIVYVADGATGIAVFARNTGTGALTFVQEYAPAGNTNGVPSVALSPDGTEVYAPDLDARVVLMYVRDPASGTLVPVESQSTPSAGLGDYSVIASPDGRHVYAGDADGDAIDVLRTVACTPAPIPSGSCKQQTQPLKGMLDLKDVTNDVVKWSWSPGATTTVGDFGDPVANDDYHLCLYDESGPPTVVLDEAAPGATVCRNACWTARPTGFKYADKLLTPDGLAAILLKAGTPAKVATTARGHLVRLPAMPLALPVRVQLQSESGGCWEATYSAAGTSVNTPMHFRAKAD